MLLPALLLTLVFSYVPMAGVVIAFQDFKPWKGLFDSEWVGFENFAVVFQRADAVQVIINTLVISGLKIVFGLIVPFFFAILLNEVLSRKLQRFIQTLVYLPHFLSWVILGGILLDLLSPNGMVNGLLNQVGVKSIFFLGSNQWFQPVVIITHIWKEFGYSTIIFLATLVGISPSLYEAAEVDGASRPQQVRYITIPSLLPITVVVGVLSLANILNAGFDQIFNLYNPLVYETGDVIDTFVYRIGLVSGQFGFATAVGLFKSIVSLIMIAIGYKLADKYANYRIF